MTTYSCCDVAALAKMSIGGTRMDFIEFDPQVYQTLSDGSERSIRGRLDHDSQMVAEGILHVGYRIALYVTPQNLNVLLPLMGFVNSSGNNWYLGDPTPNFSVVFGPNSAPEVTFANSVVAKWMMRGQRGADPIRMDMWFRGTTRVENPAGTYFVSQTNPPLLEGYPYSFVGGTMNLYSQTVGFSQFAMGVDYKTVAEWNNSVSATNLCPTDHAITVGAGALYSTCDGTTSLLTTPFSGDVTGSSFSLEFARTVGVTNYSTTFNIGNVKLIAQQPAARVKHDFVRLPLQGRGYALGTSPALTCTNVAS